MVMYDQKAVKYAENTWKWGFEWGTKQLFLYYSQNFVLIVFYISGQVEWFLYLNQ